MVPQTKVYMSFMSNSRIHTIESSSSYNRHFSNHIIHLYIFSAHTTFPSIMSGIPMRLTLVLAAITSFVDAAPHRTRPDSCEKLTSVGKAVYFITNEKENAVVALPIGPDGKLSNGTLTRTAGAGSINISGATGQPGVPDALVSQSSLTVVGNVSCVLTKKNPRD